MGSLRARKPQVRAGVEGMGVQGWEVFTSYILAIWNRGYAKG